MDLSTTYTTVSQVRQACQRLEISFKNVDARKGDKSNVSSVGLSNARPTRRTDVRVSRGATPRGPVSAPAPASAYSPLLPARDPVTGRIPLPAKLTNVPKLNDALRKKLELEGRCFAYREIGHRSSNPQCLAKV
jgi:hypothetical protein